MHHLRQSIVSLALLAASCFPGPREVVDDATTTTDVVETSPSETAETSETIDTAEVSGECEDAGDCQHLAGTCVKLLCLDRTCATQPDTGASCDDGDPCTSGDTCSGFACGGAAYSCDDGVACTQDSCDGDGGCDYPAASGFCHIGGECVTAGTVKADDPCRVCVSGESWSANDGASCEDGDAVCTLDDRCVDTACEPGSEPEDIDAVLVMPASTSGTFECQGTAATTLLGSANLVATMFTGPATISTSPTSTTLVPEGAMDTAIIRVSNTGTSVEAVLTGQSTEVLNDLEVGGSTTFGAGFVEGAMSVVVKGVPHELELTSGLADLDVFVLAMSPFGDFRWARRLGSGGNDRLTELVALSDGSALVAQSVDGDFVAPEHTVAAVGDDGNDYVVSAITANGTLAWSLRVDSVDANYAVSVAATNSSSTDLLIRPGPDGYDLRHSDGITALGGLEASGATALDIVKLDLAGRPGTPSRIASLQVESQPPGSPILPVWNTLQNLVATDGTLLVSFLAPMTADTLAFGSDLSESYQIDPNSSVLMLLDRVSNDVRTIVTLQPSSGSATVFDTAPHVDDGYIVAFVGENPSIAGLDVPARTLAGASTVLLHITEAGQMRVLHTGRKWQPLGIDMGFDGRILIAGWFLESMTFDVVGRTLEVSGTSQLNCFTAIVNSNRASECAAD